MILFPNCFYVLFIVEKFSKDFRNAYLTLLVPFLNLGSKIFSLKVGPRAYAETLLVDILSLGFRIFLFLLQVGPRAYAETLLVDILSLGFRIFLFLLQVGPRAC